MIFDVSRLPFLSFFFCGTVHDIFLEWGIVLRNSVY